MITIGRMEHSLMRLDHYDIDECGNHLGNVLELSLANLAIAKWLMNGCMTNWTAKIGITME